MNIKQLFVTVVLSSLLTAVLLVAVFAWGGFAEAQHSISEAGLARANAMQVTTSADEIAPTPIPLAGDAMTGDGFASSMDQIASAAAATPLANGVQMSHWFILGSNLLPRDSALQYVYTTNGCIYVSSSGGSTRMQFPVTLPDRSIVKSMDIFYHDTSTNNLTVWLTRYVPGQTAGDVVWVSSSGNAGWGTSSSPEVTHIVDNSAWAYALNYWWGGVTNNSLQICGIRINYIDPFYSTFLPVILRQ